MGTVYKARDPVLERLVALKTVHPGLLSKGDTLARFQREARAAAKLQHPNIVTIYELGEAGETLFIAMELLEGSDLAHAMVPVRPSDPRAEAQDRGPGLPRPRLRPQAGGLPPRREAGQRARAPGPLGQDRGLRDRAPRRLEHDPDRARARDPELHRPRGPDRRARRPPRRHVGGRGHPLRAPGRAASLRVPDHHEPRLPHRPRAPAPLGRQGPSATRPPSWPSPTRRWPRTRTRASAIWRRWPSPSRASGGRPSPRLRPSRPPRASGPTSATSPKPGTSWRRASWTGPSPRPAAPSPWSQRAPASSP